MPAALTFVTPQFAPSIGGVQTHVAQLAAHLAGRREVTVLTSATRADIAKHGRVQAVTVSEDATYTVRRFPVPAAAPELVPLGLIRAVHRAARAGHIVHAHNYHSVSLAAAAWTTALSHGTFVATPHYHGVGRTDLRTAAHRLYKPFGQSAIRAARALIAVSAQEGDLLVDAFGRRAAVIPNGVRDIDPSAAPHTLTRPTWFTCGRLETYKRVDLLIRAVAADGTHDLVIAGDGPAAPALRDLAERLGAGERVRFLGRICDHELDRWLNSDVTVATCSTIEAFGLTLADGLAARRRTIASALPAHLDVAGANPTTTFIPVPAQAPHEGGPTPDIDLAPHNALMAALAAPGAQPHRRPEHLLTWSQVADVTEALYAQLRPTRATAP